MRVADLPPKPVGKVVILENHEFEALLKYIVNNSDAANMINAVSLIKEIFKPLGNSLQMSADLWIETLIYKTVDQTIPNLETALGIATNPYCIVRDAIEYDAAGTKTITGEGRKKELGVLTRLEKLPEYLRADYARLIFGVVLYFFMRDYLGISFKPNENGNIQVEISDDCLFRKLALSDDENYCSIVDLWEKNS
jgi:hypothetical protein